MFVFLAIGTIAYMLMGSYIFTHKHVSILSVNKAEQ